MGRAFCVVSTPMVSRNQAESSSERSFLSLKGVTPLAKHSPEQARPRHLSLAPCSASTMVIGPARHSCRHPRENWPSRFSRLSWLLGTTSMSDAISELVEPQPVTTLNVSEKD